MLQARQLQHSKTSEQDDLRCGLQMQQLLHHGPQPTEVLAVGRRRRRVFVRTKDQRFQATSQLHIRRELRDALAEAPFDIFQQLRLVVPEDAL